MHPIGLRCCRAVVPASLLLAAACLSASAVGHAGQQTTGDRGYHQTITKPDPRIKIIIEKRGTMVVQLFSKETPKTTAHIIALVNRKFYDHLLFHHVVKGFMATTGDPKSKSLDGKKIATMSQEDIVSKYKLGAGGSGKTVAIEPHMGHEKGTLGLYHNARNVDSGDSQIFINLDDNHVNDGQYTAFGKIVFGQNVMSKIEQGDRIESIRLMSGLK